MSAMKKVAIAIDPWKLEIFPRHLDASGYAFENAGNLSEDSLLLRVDTTNVQALGEVVKAAQVECAKAGRPA